MTVLRWALAAACFIFSSAQAQTDKPINGIDLARACRGQAEADKSLCRGFIEGFTYGAQMAVGAEFIGQWHYGTQTWCFTRDVTDAKMREAFMTFAQANTGTLHFPAAVVLGNALAAAYPCK